MEDRRSHWPIYDPVPIEMIEIVAKTVREAPNEEVASKDGMMIYFPRRGGESAEKIRKRL